MARSERGSNEEMIGSGDDGTHVLRPLRVALRVVCG